MKVLIISDGHGNLGMLDALAAELKGADIVLYGGDFAQIHKTETGLPFLEKLVSMHDHVFSVTGNCDEIGFRDSLEKFDVNVEGVIVYYNGLVFSGSGGSSVFTGVPPNERSDGELVGDLHLIAESIPEEDIEDAGPWNNLVLIMHNPPKDTAVDSIGNGIHVGSPLLRAFVETYKPLLVVSGHIHESRAVDRLGDTVLINPGALEVGHYATLEITGGRTQPFAVTSLKLCSL